MSTDNLLNNIRVLLSLLRQIHYPHPLDPSALSSGKVESYLPILHHLLPTTAINDGKFVDKAWRVMRDELGYYPRLNKTQFLGRGFAGQKLLLVIEVIGLVKAKGGGKKRVERIDERAVVMEEDMSIMHEPLESAPRPMPFPPVGNYQEYSVEEALNVCDACGLM
jgi:hypothetical protein